MRTTHPRYSVGVTSLPQPFSPLSPSYENTGEPLKCYSNIKTNTKCAQTSSVAKPQILKTHLSIEHPPKTWGLPGFLYSTRRILYWQSFLTAQTDRSPGCHEHKTLNRVTRKVKTGTQQGLLPPLLQSSQDDVSQIRPREEFFQLGSRRKLHLQRPNCFKPRL